MFGIGRCFGSLGGYGTPFGGYGGAGGFGGGGIFMMMFMVLIISAAVYFIVKSAKKGSYHQSSSALEILKLRYAKGEISDSEYTARKEELMR